MSNKEIELICAKLTLWKAQFAKKRERFINLSSKNDFYNDKKNLLIMSFGNLESDNIKT